MWKNQATEPVMCRGDAHEKHAASTRHEFGAALALTRDSLVILVMYPCEALRQARASVGEASLRRKARPRGRRKGRRVARAWR